MLCWISIIGGLLIMMGHHARSEALFYYFRLEDLIPATHLLRLIEQHVSFEFVRQELKDRYSEMGRPSIDPELLLRILLIGYLYGITSERKLVEELRMHVAWRWFTGLGFDQEVPHHSTFSKNRHGRFQESKLFEELFEQIVRQCVDVGLVQGQHLSVDGSFVEANAAKESRVPREQLAEAAEVHQTVRQYLQEVEQQNPIEEPVHQQEQVSTTDPDSTYATKGGTPARLGYYDNYLVDNDSCVIVGVQATAARMSQETVAAQDMLTRFAAWQGRAPTSVAADTTYGNGEFLQWLADRNITPYMRTRDSIHRKNSPFYGPERFTYEPENNRYICPANQPLNYGGRNMRNRTYAYIGTRKRHTISPSSIADSAFNSFARAEFRTGNDLNSFPLREISLHFPYSIRAIARKPSNLISKSQSGWENGSGLRPTVSGWKRGSGTIQEYSPSVIRLCTSQKSRLNGSRYFACNCPKLLGDHVRLCKGQRAVVGSLLGGSSHCEQAI